MMNRTSIEVLSRGKLRMAFVGLTAAVVAIATWSPPQAQATPPEQAKCCFEVMTYNAYLGTNLQPLFQAKDLDELRQLATRAYAHVHQVDFNLRAVAIARQIVQAEPEVVALQELSLWQEVLLSNPSELTTRYDFLQILLAELERQGHPYKVASMIDTFSSDPVPINDSEVAAVKWTDRNAIIVRADLPASELTTANPMAAKFAAYLPLTIVGTPIKATRAWTSVDVEVRGTWFRVFDTHFEAFHPLVRLAQVGELVAIMSASPYPIVLAGDINLYPRSAGRPEDQPAWNLLTGAGFVDAWVESDGAFPAYTAGQPDDLDCRLPSTLDNTVDFVLHNADGYVDAVRHSGDIVGEVAADCTESTAHLWPSDHAGVVVALHIPES
jgi:endonuclease/exonuclease/phosphatase family metal-dependent hydrolase